MKNAITNYENTFFLDGAALSGVISVDGEYTLSMQPINVIGKGFTKQVVAEVPKASVNITRYLVNKDPVIDLTGDGYDYIAQALSGGIVYNNKNFGFEQGYLSSYGITCSVGEVPQIQSKFDVYGNIGSGINPSGSGYGGGVFVPQVKNIIVNCNNSSTNRVKSFNINVDCPNVPIYAIRASNSEIPIEVQNVFPIQVDGSFTLDIDDYETKKMFDILNSNNISNFGIAISGTVLEDIPLTISSGSQESLTLSSGSLAVLYSYLKSEDNVPIYNFSTSNAIILSEQINSSADDLMSVKISYKTYLN